jgi:hypothetical protein
MRLGKAILALTVFGFLASCDRHDPTGPAEQQNNGGVGNQTLLVRAEVDVEPRTGGFLTEFVVEVRDRDNQPVSGADVTIEWNYSPIQLTESGDPGIYTAELSGPGSGPLKLHVEKDGMYVRDVVLGNIGIHAITEPEPHDTVPANAPLRVRWVSDTEAPSAALFTRGEYFEVPDQGEFVIPASQNPASSDQYIELERYNEVQLSGGLPGSYFLMEVEWRVEPVVILEQP